MVQIMYRPEALASVGAVNGAGRLYLARVRRTPRARSSGLK